MQLRITYLHLSHFVLGRLLQKGATSTEASVVLLRECTIAVHAGGVSIEASAQCNRGIQRRRWIHRHNRSGGIVELGRTKLTLYVGSRKMYIKAK
jgi:hypothetical protein